VPIPANVEIYNDALIDMIEFKALTPDALLSLIDEDLSIDVILNGKKNDIQKMAERSILD